MNVVLRVQTQELRKTNTSAEGETLAALKQVLKLPSVSGWSPESRGCLPSGVKWSNCTVKSVKRHLLLNKTKDVQELYVSYHKTSNSFDYQYIKKNVCSTRDNSLLLALLSGCREKGRESTCSQVGCYSPAAQSIKLFHHSKSFCNSTDLSRCCAIVPCW